VCHLIHLRTSLIKYYGSEEHALTLAVHIVFVPPPPPPHSVRRSLLCFDCFLSLSVYTRFDEYFSLGRTAAADEISGPVCLTVIPAAVILSLFLAAAAASWANKHLLSLFLLYFSTEAEQSVYATESNFAACLKQTGRLIRLLIQHKA
jgi:hypothetical protein